jgi:hypothetical protein
MLEEAWRRGYRHVIALTDIVFHAKHPERRGRPLSRDETPLISEWMGIRDRLVRPFLARTAAAVPANGRLGGWYR